MSGQNAIRLREAAELVLVGGWTQGEMFTDHLPYRALTDVDGPLFAPCSDDVGAPIRIETQNATFAGYRCMYSAIVAASAQVEAPLEALTRGITLWNDQPGRTAVEVAHMLERAAHWDEWNDGSRWEPKNRWQPSND